MNSETIIQILETNCSSPRQIALLRRTFLEEYNGLPSLLVPIIQDSVKEFLKVVHTAETDSALRISDEAATCHLGRLLDLQPQLTQNDAILGEEIQRAQSQHTFSQLIQYDVTRFETLEQQEDVMEMQDKACELVTKRQASLPYTVDELCARLPMALNVAPAGPGNAIEILIHQVTDRQSAQEDVGFGKSHKFSELFECCDLSQAQRISVLWPSAVVLSRWLVTEPFVLKGKRVLELGAGCGLTGLVAASLQQRDCFQEHGGSVVLTDFNATVLKNLQRNINLNDLSSLNCNTVGLDFYHKQTSDDGWQDTNGNLHELVDVVLAADMICQPEDAVASAQTIHDVLVPGGKAYVVCADAAHRFGVGEFDSACRNVGLQIETKDVKCLYDGEFLKSGLDVTSGYVDGMSLTIYFLSKPNERLWSSP